MKPDAKPSICFVSMEAYTTLRPGTADLAGGAGFQVVQLARGLRKVGYPISFVVGDYGQPLIEEIDGFPVHRSNKVAYDRSKFRVLQNMVRLFGAMRRAKADYYVLRSTRFLSFFVMLFARLLGARYVFMVANISHCVREELENLPPIFRRLYALSLRHAYRVTTQFHDQRAMLKANFDIESGVVPNGLDAPPLPDPLPEAQWDAAWIATVKASKRPDRLIHIAKAAPDLKFVVAGGPGHDPVYFQQKTAELVALPNVEYVGFVPQDQVEPYYAKSRLYLMTSDLEGFPNTFLYSWSKGRPVVSTAVDPDNLLSEKGLGVVEGDLDRMAVKMRELLADPDRYQRLSRESHQYVRDSHSIDAAIKAFTGHVFGVAD